MPEKNFIARETKGRGRAKTTSTLSRKKTQEKVQSLSLDDMIANLQKLGFNITAPSGTEIREKQEESIEKLGLKPKTKQIKVTQPKTVVLTLNFQHTLGPNIYGPGQVVLDASDEDTLRTLLHAEQGIRAHYMELPQFGAVGGSYLISMDAGSKVKKIAVTENQLQSMDRLDGSVNVIQPIEAAGYNPNILNQGIF